MSQGIIARRYAKALINMAEEKNALEKTVLNFSNLANIFKDSIELREIFSDTKISSNVKQKLLNEVLDKIKEQVIQLNEPFLYKLYLLQVLLHSKVLFLL